mgnify:CR=1 FL=1
MLAIFIIIVSCILYNCFFKEHENSSKSIEKSIRRHYNAKSKKTQKIEKIKIAIPKDNNTKNLSFNEDLDDSYNNIGSEYEFLKNISYDFIDEIVTNVLNKKYKLTFNNDNILTGIKCYSNSYSLEFLCNSLLVFNKNHDKVLGDIQKISIYKLDDKKNIVDFYIKDNLYMNDIPQNIDNIYVSLLYQHNDIKRTNNKQMPPFVILMYNNQQRIHQLLIQETNRKQYDACNSFYTNIFIKNYDNEPQCFNQITSFYVTEIGSKKSFNIYNGNYDLNLPLVWENNYFSLLEYRNDKNNLKIYHSDKIIHYVKNINNCFSLMKKVNKNGSYLCEVFNTTETDYQNKSLLKLNKNGKVSVLASGFIKYENMYDYLRSIDSIDINFNLIDENGYVNIFFFKKECLNFYILDEYTNNADEKIILKNKFDDDETINYRVKYKKDRILDLAFVQFLLNTRRGASLSFDNGLYGGTLKNNFFAGTAIYNIPFLDYYKGLKGDFEYLNSMSQLYLEEEQIDNFKLYVKNIYKKYNMEYYPYSLPSEFKKNEIAADILLDKLYKYINNNPLYEIDYRTMKVYDDEKREVADLKEIKEKIKKDLIVSKKYNSRWKSEVELYNLVLKYYPNAIYQYRSEFLGMQSFDIFIPDIKVAIEYQGIQHYEAVDIFGGIEGLRKRKLLDDKKRKICKKNNIKLIEWKYSEIISKHSLEKHINEVCEK